jgi:hypothetical protein
MDSAFEAAWVALSLIRMLKGDLAGAAEAVRSLKAVNPEAGFEAWMKVIEDNMPEGARAAALEGFKAAWAAAG